jgi:hypothetical protein
MGGIDMIDVAIGMAFLFSMVALSASTIREMIESSLKSRAIMIETGLRELLSDREGNQIMEDFFQHPQIAALFAGEYRSDALTRPFMSTPYFAGSNRRFLGRLWDRWRKDKMKLRNAVSQARSKEKRLPFRSNLPTYIPTRNFAIALLDMAARGPVDLGGARPQDSTPLSLGAIRAGIASLPSEPLQRLVLNALDRADGTVEGAICALGDSYDSTMDRVSGWYKRQTQKILFAIGLVLAAGFNVDSLAVMQRLSVDDQWRAAIVQSATKAGEVKSGAKDQIATPAKGDLQPIKDEADRLQTELDNHGFFSGTHPFSKDAQDWAILRAIPGWLITALAAALGAPFWFDLLARLMTIRSTFKPKPEETTPVAGLAVAVTGTQSSQNRPGAASPLERRESAFISHRWATGDPQEGAL